MKINKLYRLYILLCLTMLCFTGIVSAQSPGTEVRATIVDEQGNPLSDVEIYGSNDSSASTNDKGQFKINVLRDESFVIQKKGYESKLVGLSTTEANKITLLKSKFLASEDDEIDMGVTVRNRRDIVGSVSSMNTKDRLTYDNTQFVRDYITGLTVGVRGSSNIRGIGNALFVIDGVFGRDPNVLNMEEVEQITILKDANAVALYGSQGENGVIIINTKRGKINKREVNVNLRSGIRTAISYPNYLDAASFMVLRDEARINDGIDPTDGSLFRNSLNNPILNTRSGLSPVEFPDVDLYDFARDFTRTTNLISEFSGGNNKSQYYINVGWLNEQGWVDVNDDINEGRNRFNVRGNIDFKVNDWITSSIDAVAIINTTKSSRANLLNAATTFLPFDYAPLLPLNLIDYSNNPDLVTLLDGAVSYDGNLLGTSQTGASSPLALAIAGGTEDRVTRATQFNNAINFDLSAITDGLSAKTYVSFDFFDTYTREIRNQFRTYSPRWENNRIVAFDDGGVNEFVFGIDQRDLRLRNRSNGFVTRVGSYVSLDYKNTFGDHSINTTALGYYNSENRDGVLQTDRDAHLGFQATYDFKKKLYVDFSSAYTHSLKLPEGSRGGFSPTFGLAYILSEESFIKDVDFINYLKLKASGGIIKSDRLINGYYFYDENYSQGSSFGWADGLFSNRRQNISQAANSNMTFVERIDLNLGIESYLMDSLWLEANLFRTERDKLLTFLADQYPSYYNDFRPRDNFNANLYTGLELGLNYNKSFKDFSVAVGANLLYSQTEASKRSETNEFSYQNRQGLELTTIFGYEDLGFYQENDFISDADGSLILNSILPEPNLGTVVQPGDIRYADQNNDGIIDQNDQVALGQSANDLAYGINVNIKYKGLSLFVLARGESGGLGNKLTGFSNYYSPDGTDKYSEVVLNRWTPATANTATFPRLTSGQNRNNFRTSSFWLYDNSFFRIDRAQITYEFPNDVCDIIGVKDFSFNLQGSNLLELGENKDIRRLNIGGNPQARTYTFGLRASF